MLPQTERQRWLNKTYNLQLTHIDICIYILRILNTGKRVHLSIYIHVLVILCLCMHVLIHIYRVYSNTPFLLTAWHDSYFWSEAPDHPGLSTGTGCVGSLFTVRGARREGYTDTSPTTKSLRSSCCSPWPRTSAERWCQHLTPKIDVWMWKQSDSWI